jgi:alanyl aminopeptidase
MITRSLCAFAASVFTLAATGQAAAPRLGRDVIPTFQLIELRLDARQDGYEGTTRIELDVKRPTRTFFLHAEALDIGSITLSRSGEEVSCRYQAEDSATLLVEAAFELEPGPLVLEAVFTNDYDRRAEGLFKAEVEGESYTFTQFEEDDAREAFPCFDEPSFKFPYQLVLTVPASHLALANTPIESEDVRGEWRTVRFRKSPPMPSYLVALATGPFDTVSIPGLSVPSRVVTTRGKAGLAGLAMELAPPIMRSLEEYFGGPCPYEKLDLVGVPEFWPGAMENPGAITFSEGLLLVDSAQAGVRARRDLATTMAHEFAHLWFGDLVTMAWWDDLWLNESFAEWLGEKTAHKLYPELGIDISSAQSVGRTMDSDARPSSRAIRQPVAASTDLTSNLGPIYSKGQAVLDMFEQYLGEEALRQSLQAYIKERAWSNATADDLFRTLSREAGWDVGAALSTFIDQPGIPLVSVTVESSGRLVFRQSRFANYGVEVPELKPWHIPLSVRYAYGGTVQEQTLVLAEPVMTADLGKDGPPDWIMPNGDARAYCRWNVPFGMMLALARSAETTLTARERVGFLGNLAALLDAGVVKGDEYLELVAGFRNDPHPQVISAVAGAVGNVESSFVADSLKPLFAGYVRHTLGPAVSRFGLERREGEDETVTQLRPRLLTWLADIGDTAVLAHMQSVFQACWTDAGPVDPELRSLSVQLACRTGDRALFDSCRVRFESAEVPALRAEYLAALGSFRDPAIQEEALKYALTGPLRPQELWDIPTEIASASEAESERIFHWFLEHYDDIAAKMPPMYRSYLPMIASGCSLPRLERARAFFSEPSHAVPGVESRLARVADAVHECVNLREREGVNVAAYLAAGFTGAPEAPAGGSTGSTGTR